MNPEQAVFRIQNLSCSYIGKRTRVLCIDHLDLPRGKLIVILGKSGSGKSTILEALGLMNNTMDPDSSIIFSPGVGSEIVNYQEVWKSSQKQNIDSIRKQHFSFIFQSTNLMPNFTAYENIIMSLLIQGKDQDYSMQLAEEFMTKVDLKDISKRKKTFELSGGQKQRLAFVRAIIRDFTVLFGDEPTGNLDEVNSRELMHLLKESIKSRDRTAIIVSHNIELSCDFADQILVLTKDKDYGEFKGNNAFRVNDNAGVRKWVDAGNNEISDIQQRIRFII